MEHTYTTYNNQSNHTGLTEEEDTGLGIVIIAINWLVLFPIGFVGNLFVILSIALIRHLQKLTSALLLSLAVADLLFIFFVLFDYVLFAALFHHQHEPEYACRVYNFSEFFFAVASVFNLCAVSLGN